MGEDRKHCVAMITAALVLWGCATDSGFVVCRAKGDKENLAEQRADAHEELAESYRFSRDEDRARYHDALAEQERDKAAKESNPVADLFFAIFGNCDR